MIRDELVVCEVKARASVAFGTPAEAITSTKQLRLRRATAALLAELRVDQSLNIRHVRFDVACVLGSQLEMLMDAF
jgi:putative endonuclease